MLIIMSKTKKRIASKTKTERSGPDPAPRMDRLWYAVTGPDSKVHKYGTPQAAYRKFKELYPDAKECEPWF